MFSPLELPLTNHGRTALLLSLPWLLLAGLPWLASLPAAPATSLSLLLVLLAAVQTRRLTTQAWVSLQLRDGHLLACTTQGRRIPLEVDPASRVFARCVLLGLRHKGKRFWQPLLLTDLPLLANCAPDSLRRLRVALRMGALER